MLQLPARKTRSGRDFSDFRLEILDDSEDSEADFKTDAEEESEDDAQITPVTNGALAETPTAKRKRKRPQFIGAPSPTISAQAESSAAPTQYADTSLPHLDAAAPKPDRQRLRRRKRRKTERDATQAESGSKSKTHCVKRTTEASRVAVEIDLDSDGAREPTTTLRTRRRWGPASVPKGCKLSLEAALELGFSYDDWDGKSQIIYIDRKGRELAVLCGRPRDDNWDAEVAEAAALLMKELAPQLSPLDPHSTNAAQDTKKKKKKKKKKKRSTRRGDHRAETVGVGMGNGRTQPANFRNDEDDAAVLEKLLGSRPFTRVAGFSMLLNFAPRLHDYYQNTMDALFERYPWLRRIFERHVSVFPSCTFNFGPETVTIPHLDLLNLAWGWCFITALGWFDPNKGGHLILWDLKRIVHFPPGSSIAIPSALIRHSNVSIQQGEIRYSFTQFAAGGLFRFVENNFELNELVRVRVARMSVEERAQWVAAEGVEVF
ncbi:hypothetical protein HMN09_00533900 [Mycena chlorophos]|uniref:Uncharacterized protein n=1 Tax=Mycena chlorophos TaxID=658473 RepID=A0A8H6T8E7_MYCCL|nr:hypothetical protein HMN09_00533900 [Mycena chlorophos]